MTLCFEFCGFDFASLRLRSDRVLLGSAQRSVNITSTASEEERARDCRYAIDRTGIAN